jgi:hypothetical protein
VSVDVGATPERAFEVMSDLREKAPLNPNARSIRVELLGGEPVREGSVFAHRLQRGRQVMEYRTRCVRHDPPRRYWSRSETDPPFEVRVTVDPLAGGCRVTQEERLEVSAAVMDTLEPPPGPSGLHEAFRWMALFPALRPLDGHLRALQRDRITRRFTAELSAWLAAIKAHLEAGPSALRGGAA